MLLLFAAHVLSLTPHHNRPRRARRARRVLHVPVDLVSLAHHLLRSQAPPDPRAGVVQRGSQMCVSPDPLCLTCPDSLRRRRRRRPRRRRPSSPLTRHVRWCARSPRSHTSPQKAKKDVKAAPAPAAPAPAPKADKKADKKVDKKVAKKAPTPRQANSRLYACPSNRIVKAKY